MRILLSLLLLLAICVVAPTVCADETAAPTRPGYFMGRQIAPTMSYLGADWLVRTTREKEERPDLLIAALGLERGQRVCDFGSGNGYYTLRLAPLVAPVGRVDAVELQPEMLELLAARAEARGIENVQTVLATDTQSGLAERAYDLVLLVDVYHELADPAAALAELRQSLRPTGRVALVEFRLEDPYVPIKPLHKMTQAQCLKEFRSGGLKLVGQFDRLPWQHVLFFARDDSPLAEARLVGWSGVKHDEQ
ncbi:MAG: methyltransferase domain-containing protein [Planctomycetota bacterium]